MDTDLESATRTELLRRARERDVPGRSSMSKEQLLEHLRPSADGNGDGDGDGA